MKYQIGYRNGSGYYVAWKKGWWIFSTSDVIVNEWQPDIDSCIRIIKNNVVGRFNVEFIL